MKKKLPKTCEKRFYKYIIDVLFKKRLEKTLNIGEMRRFRKLEKWPQCKGYSPCKMVSLGKKMKLPKTCEKPFYKHFPDVLCKKRLQKTLIIREMRRFWILEKWPQCKGYSLCKMVSLGQKIKLPKTCEKRFYKYIIDVLCKKRLQKILNIGEMRRIRKLEKWPQCKGYSPCKMVSLGKKMKLPKTCEKPFYKHFPDVLCKKRLQKTLIIREMRRFWILEKWPQCKGYSLCKMVSLGQKMKLPKTCEKLFYKYIIDVLWKKRLQKILNIGEMRRY